MRYRLVIFDFDGTLADSFGWFVGMVNDVADRFGFRRIDEHEIDALRGLRPRELIAELGIPIRKLPGIAAYVRRLAAANLHEVALFPGVEHMLRRLADAGVALAIVTSNSYDNVRCVLGPDNVSLIRSFECGTAIFGKKTRLKRVLARLDTPPAGALFVGDEIRDADAARAVGIPFGAVTWGFASPAALAALGPDFVFESAAEITELLTRPGTDARRRA